MMNQISFDLDTIMNTVGFVLIMIIKNNLCNGYNLF
jgi:hypothetical protein